jgi:hypothetical protein
MRDVARRELRGGHLVEQGLELVMVVAVDQGDRHVLVVGESLRAPEAREPAADDHHVTLVVRGRHRTEHRPWRWSVQRGAHVRAAGVSRRRAVPIVSLTARPAAQRR